MDGRAVGVWGMYTSAVLGTLSQKTSIFISPMLVCSVTDMMPRIPSRRVSCQVVMVPVSWNGMLVLVLSRRYPTSDSIGLN